tara:strand:- start:36148 stop:37092 length:945 start_codon:yes stop_codon:yes gene_type:complete
MPQNINYSPIISLISQARISSYSTTFRTNTNAELFGVYTWSQHVSGALFPLIQGLEITIRNSIDAEARRRFGDFWWDSIGCRGQVTNTKFYENINRAKQKLTRSWKKLERTRLNLRRNAQIPTQIPSWTHDQLVAATDFSTWHFILNKEFSAPNNAQPNSYLWPISLGRAFRNYNNFNSNANNARTNLMDAIFELREYRNRIFHHEPIWTKAPGTNSPQLAINSIREKINKIEKLINTVDRRKIIAMEKVGLFSNVRRICSTQELDIYMYRQSEAQMTKRQKRIMRKKSSLAQNENKTLSWEHNGCLFGMNRIR